jgi:RNA polymerase sigma-70 factor (ECF subfamily)
MSFRRGVIHARCYVDAVSDENKQPSAGRDDSGMLALYELHRDAVLRFLRARTRDPDEAQDILQELWIRLRQLRPGPIANGRAYLYQMANNLVLDRVRERRRRAVRDQNWVQQNFEVAQGAPGESHALDTSPRPEEALSEADELRQLQLAIAALPERARQVFCLHKLDGLGHAEVANRLGITRSAVEKHIAVAMKSLRRTLLDCGSDGPAASPIPDE